MRNSTYGEVSFLDTDADTVLTELISAYEELTGRTLYPADPVRLFINWVANVIIQQRVCINEAARQNVPRYAEGEYLDSLGELFYNVRRQQGVPATVMMQMNISAVQDDDVTIEAGTRVKAGENIMFATNETAVIKAGETSVTVIATATEAGAAHNGYTPGQINKIVDPYPYYSSVENITTSSGGVDTEDDDSLYNRMRESLEGYSTAGAKGGYKYFAESADERIADVSVTSPSAGNVSIKVLLDGGELPEEDVINKVLSAVNADDVRPLTDKVTVSAASTQSYNIDLEYYIGKPNADSTEVIKNAVNNAITEYINWQSAKMGRDINPSKLINLVMQAGAKRVVVTAPTYAVVPEGTVAKLGTQDVSYGGLEDE